MDAVILVFHRLDEMNAVESLILSQLNATNTVEQPLLESKNFLRKDFF